MLGLNETATLYKRMGQSGGKPAYSEEGVEFACRSEPAQAWTPSCNSVERSADTRIFALPSIPASPGDRIVFDDDSRVIVSEVQKMRGFAAVHHLEILAKTE